MRTHTYHVELTDEQAREFIASWPEHFGPSSTYGTDLDAEVEATE